jgi:hypothetical protein
MGLRAANIEHGRVVDVNMSSYTITVATEYTKKPLTDISFAVPYCHSYNGEGIYFMPEVGSLCWICEPSDGSMPFVLAWSPSQDENDFRARRQDLNPGDIYLGTRDGNQLWLRRGGVVQIGATGLCQRIFLPVNNTINDFCENYNLQTLGGSLNWNIVRSENDTDGHRPALFALNAKEFADDPDPIATLEIGSHGSSDDTILLLSIKASGNQGAAEQISLKMDKDGNINFTCVKDFNHTVKGKYTVSATGDMLLTSSGNAEVHGDSSAKLSSKQTSTVQGGTSVVLDGPVTKTTNIFQVGGGGNPLAMAIPLIEWLASHVHNITTPSPGSPTSPPTVPPLPTISSQHAFSDA